MCNESFRTTITASNASNHFDPKLTFVYVVISFFDKIEKLYITRHGIAGLR